jgi:hypothetical protein
VHRQLVGRIGRRSWLPVRSEKKLLSIAVSDQTGRGAAVYLYVIGTNLDTGKLGYVNAAGTFANWPAGANSPSAAPDVAIGGPGNGGRSTIQLR